MMNTKTGGVIGVIIAIIVGIGIIYAISDSSLSSDMSNSDNESAKNVTSDSLSNPTISDDAIINTGNEDHELNEDGKRHYTLVATSEPTVAP